MTQITIKYVVHIDTTTNHITRVSYPRYNTPAEGVSETERIVYVNDDNMPSVECNNSAAHFLNNYVWDAANSSFYFTGEKPNKHASWNASTASWDWDSEALLNDIRDHRRGKLNQSDWAVLPDNTFTSEQQTQIRTYRTALRDFPATLDMTTISCVEDVTWPTPPEFL